MIHSGKDYIESLRGRGLDVWPFGEWIFFDGEYEFAAILVERFTCYHRRSGWIRACGSATT